MTRFHTPILGLATIAIAIATPVAAHDFKVGSLTLQHPWTRATAGKVGAGYTIIVNSGKTADQLVSASSPAVDKVEIHTMTMDSGVMKMRPLPDGIAIPAGGTARLAPGGYHLMLLGLKAPLVAGKLVPLTLNFAKAGPVKVQLKVEAAGAAEPAHANHAK
ncbi:MAG: copper chaperone PCu(A)C [Polymorphobacter sp.]